MVFGGWYDDFGVYNSSKEKHKKERNVIKTLVDEDKRKRIPPHEGTKGAMESLQ